MMHIDKLIRLSVGADYGFYQCHLVMGTRGRSIGAGRGYYLSPGEGAAPTDRLGTTVGPDLSRAAPIYRPSVDGPLSALFCEKPLSRPYRMPYIGFLRSIK